MSEVSLAPYRAEHLEALTAYTLPPEQAEFTALPAELLASVQGDPQRLAVTILNADRPVGLFALSVGPHRDKYLSQPDPDGVALSALSLNPAWQGQGLATQALAGLRAFIPRHFSEARRVLLVVNQRNPAARRVYEKVGFQVQNERLGVKGPQWVMTLALDFKPQAV